MSVIQDILEGLSKHLVNTDSYFAGKKFYFDLSQVTASTDMPCFCFNSTGTMEDSDGAGLNPDCRSLLRTIEFIALTDTTDSELLIKELWDFEEKLIKNLREVFPQDINPNFFTLKYTNTSSIDSLWTKTEGEQEGKFLCNMLYCVYDIEYQI